MGEGRLEFGEDGGYSDVLRLLQEGIVRITKTKAGGKVRTSIETKLVRRFVLPFPSSQNA